MYTHWPCTCVSWPQLCEVCNGETVDPSMSKRSGLHLSVTQDWRCILIQLPSAHKNQKVKKASAEEGLPRQHLLLEYERMREIGGGGSWMEQI